MVRPAKAGKGTATGASAPAAPPVKPPAGSSGPGSRIALRNWRISTRLVSLLALPVVAATSLGALRISDNMDDIQQLDNMRLLTDITKQATELSSALQEERDQSAGPLANNAPASDIGIKGVRDKVDRARANFIDGAEEIDAASKTGNLQGVRESLVGLVSELGDINEIRSNAYASEDNSTQTIEAYHRLITHLLELSQDMAEATSNPEMITRTRALAAFSSAKEYASVQRAVIAAALPADNKSIGDLSENDRLYGDSALNSQDSELKSFISIYGSGAEDLLKSIDEGNPTITAADLYARRILESRDGIQGLPKRSYKDWVDDDSAKIQQMKIIEITLLSQMEQKARELRNEAEQEAIISGALILLVLGVSLVGAFVVARSMIRSLRRLQDTATKVAQDRLPELVKQLSESDPQDVDTSVESVGVHSRDEIGQVAAAFDDVHREAVRLAAEQALLRGNVNAMFTNLSRRSQGLIQRQLSLISELESREADPDQLSSLFKLDHLATRMRRNGENLLVLAGEEPGRRWTRPVPLVDVLRAAASEVEQYERIELSSVPTTEVAGRVVNDLVHLLAELLENATSFSSPQTKVKVTGHALPDGRVLIEIHDTGIGLSPEDLAAINERLAAPPTVDVSVSRRMGLFVVGRLSQRHGIRIQLRPSDSGGTTALVMLPVDVAQGGKKPAPGKPGQGGAPSAPPPRRPPPVWPRPAGAVARVLPPVAGSSAPVALRAARSVPATVRGPRCPAGTRAVARVPRVRRRVDRRVRVPRSRVAGRLRPVRVPAASAARLPALRRACRPREPRRASATARAHARARTPSATAVVVRTPSVAARAVPYRRSAATTSRAAGAVRSSRRVAVRVPSCPVATRRPAPAGATRTRSRRSRGPRWTPRAATRNRTPPHGCRASTTGRVPARRRRSPASTISRARPRPTTPRARAVPRTRVSSPSPTSAARPPTRTASRTTGSTSAPTSSARRPPGSRTRRTTDSSRRPRTTAARRASSRRRTGTTATRPASSPRPPASTTGARCRAARRTRRPPASSSVRSRARAVVPPTSAAPVRRFRRARRSRRRCRRRAVPVTDVRLCTTPWRPTGSTGRVSRGSRRTACRRPTAPAMAPVTAMAAATVRPSRHLPPRPLPRVRRPRRPRRVPGAPRPTTSW